jgi:hypothetical protein
LAPAESYLRLIDGLSEKIKDLSKELKSEAEEDEDVKLDYYSRDRVLFGFACEE